MNAAQRPWSLAGFSVNLVAFGVAVGFALDRHQTTVRFVAVVALAVIALALHGIGHYRFLRDQKARGPAAQAGSAR